MNAYELRGWLTRRQVLQTIHRTYICEFGHEDCSTHFGGPCFREALGQMAGFARDRAIELQSHGANYEQAYQALCTEFGHVPEPDLDGILHEAFP